MKSYVLGSLGLILLSSLLNSSLVSALSIQVVVPADGLLQSGRPTTVRWAHEPQDPLGFDFRFVIDEVDVGLARANIVVNNPQNESGEVRVTFPRPGLYRITAVSDVDGTITQIGTSNEVEVLPLNSQPATVTVTVSAASASTPTAPTSTARPAPSSMPASEPQWSRNARAGIIAGIVLGTIVLVVLAVFITFLIRRNRIKKKAERLSFHPEQMIQRRRSRFMSLVPKRFTSIRSPRQLDPEQAVEAAAPSRTNSTSAASPRSPPTSPKTARFLANNPFVSFPDHAHRNRPLPTPPVSAFVPPGTPNPLTPQTIRPLPILPPVVQITPASPRPRLPDPPRTAPAGSHFLPPLRKFSESPPLSAHFERHRALPIVPRTQRQQQLEDRLVEVRTQIEMLEQQKEGANRVLKDLRRQMQWLMDNIDSEWALGVTDVTPPGFSRFMTP
ncbi:hypothetical protein FA15DRAFT_670233 [Coprinopsis marcescibilis]|uniref:Epidermal growth factor receptor-like transmembrane-juxtamembrane segment domain-containing protein n=1 Tax=Coprinopsis marcescibilis TaxID=230819 RepID=A0A5C3KTJ6_COPMA|nr:hypothetical protein FA15DRAFT_670233 [Coprinopsis marcescibilis]